MPGALLLVLLSSAATADDTSLCPALTLLAYHATAEATDAQALSDLTTHLDAETCGTALTQTAMHEIHCRWSFDYRNDAAIALHDDLTSDIQTCLNATAVPQEEGVNHPDSYDRQQFRARDVALSLSLKDKAALQRTYVFLRAVGG